MTPYADFLYFGVTLYVALPTLLLGLAGRLSRAWILVAGAGMLVVQYWAIEALGPNAAVREIWLVLGFAVFQYALAEAFLRLRARTASRAVFYSAVLLAILPLVAARFVPLVAPNTLVGFLGISYLTFRSVDVIINVQDRMILNLPAGQYFAYLLFFPTISSGPIDRYRRFAEDWKCDRTRAEFFGDLDGAVHRIFTGFLYKFILAALIKRYWLDPVAGGHQVLDVISYMYAYSFYLFFDFAGYSAFAVGFSYLLGIHTPENFNRPFLARNIRDFWNRWHISLSWWFRDHVYTRFVFSATKGHWFKSRYTASYLGYLLSMGLMGLWHGTAPHYILYGLYHASLLIGHDRLSRWNKQHKVWGDGRAWHVASIAVTFNLVCFGLLLFSGRLG